MFTPIWGRFPFWRAFFSDGWFNHQPVFLCEILSSMKVFVRFFFEYAWDWALDTLMQTVTTNGDTKSKGKQLLNDRKIFRDIGEEEGSRYTQIGGVLYSELDEFNDFRNFHPIWVLWICCFCTGKHTIQSYADYNKPWVQEPQKHLSNTAQMKDAFVPTSKSSIMVWKVSCRIMNDYCSIYVSMYSLSNFLILFFSYLYHSKHNFFAVVDKNTWHLGISHHSTCHPFDP